MSYILDALRKAERERTRGAVPGLDAQQMDATVRPRRSFWPLWILLALVLNAAVLGWLFWQRGTEQVADATPTAPPVAIAPVAQPVPPPPPVASPPAAVAAPPQPAPVVETAQPVASPTVTGAAHEPAAEPTAIPLWNALPEDQRAGLPRVVVDVHVYADDPAQRFVLVNMRRYVEGERLPDGPTLEAITEDGVVLSHNGRRYRIERQ